MQLRELEIQQLEGEHRKQVAAATIGETELIAKSSAVGSDTAKLSELFTERNTTKSKQLVQDWVISSAAGNIADVANELHLRHSESISQSNQATAIRASSAQPLNSHRFDLNANGQVEAIISLIVNMPEDTGNRNFVIDNAALETYIIQEEQQPQIHLHHRQNFDMRAQLNPPNSVCGYHAFRWSAV